MGPDCPEVGQMLLEVEQEGFPYLREEGSARLGLHRYGLVLRLIEENTRPGSAETI